MTSFIPKPASAVDRNLDENIRNWFLSGLTNTEHTTPSVNINETQKEFNIELAAPGMRKEDFEINLDNNILTISSEHKEEKGTEEKQYSRKEFSFQSFRRSFSIDEDRIDSDKIDAHYKDGILLVTIPKKEVTKPKGSRVITVK
jgi:HSP20 family protein